MKVYLLNNGAYVAKKKTKIARKTLDPLYQQALLFDESPQGKVLQVSKHLCGMITNACMHVDWYGRPPPGNSLGGLRPHGPQKLHGSCTNLTGGAGPLEHSHWLVQAVPTGLVGGSNARLSDPQSFSVVPRQLVWTRRSPILDEQKCWGTIKKIRNEKALSKSDNHSCRGSVSVFHMHCCQQNKNDKCLSVAGWFLIESSQHKNVRTHGNVRPPRLQGAQSWCSACLPHGSSVWMHRAFFWCLEPGAVSTRPSVQHVYEGSAHPLVFASPPSLPQPLNVLRRGRRSRCCQSAHREKKRRIEKKFWGRINVDGRPSHLACAHLPANEKANHLCTGVLQTSEEVDQYKFMSHIANGRKDALIFHRSEGVPSLNPARLGFLSEPRLTFFITNTSTMAWFSFFFLFF